MASGLSSANHAADVAVVGAGPTGAVAALAFARRGARVVLIEGHPEAASRFAGEWVHPPGVRALRSLGIDTSALASREGRGFALFGDDGGDPVCLPYDGGVSIAREHAELVGELREHACSHALVRYLPNHVFARLDDHTLELTERASGSTVTVSADRIIGADGRGSKVRAAIDGTTPSEQLSFMAGLELKDAPLPFEGLGHVFLGGPGPALLYRIDERRIRACLDVPVSCSSEARRKEAVYEGFRAALPPQLEPALRAAVREPFPWAATGVRRRLFFGRGHVWLAGDAVGHVHPLSGIGITLGVMDAEAAARASDLGEYERLRSARIAELVARVLYAAFAGKDASAGRIRHALLAMLRNNAEERQRTMRLLTGDDRAGNSFAEAFLRACGQVLLTGAGNSVAGRQSLLDWGRQLKRDADWLAWPLRAWVPAADDFLVQGAPGRSAFATSKHLMRTFKQRRNQSDDRGRLGLL